LFLPGQHLGLVLFSPHVAGRRDFSVLLDHQPVAKAASLIPSEEFPESFPLKLVIACSEILRANRYLGWSDASCTEITTSNIYRRKMSLQTQVETGPYPAPLHTVRALVLSQALTSVCVYLCVPRTAVQLVPAFVRCSAAYTQLPPLRFPVHSSSSHFSEPNWLAPSMRGLLGRLNEDF